MKTLCTLGGWRKNDDNNLVYACMGVKERFAGPDRIEYKNNKLHKVPNKKRVHTSKMKMEYCNMCKAFTWERSTAN